MSSFAALLVVLSCGLFLLGDAVIFPSSPRSKYHIAGKEIHLKHGKLHPHERAEEDDHLVYRYRWLGDDIVKKEVDFEGQEDNEYDDKEKKVKLPGGCELTEDQFLELESFRRETDYVKKCYCEQGGVYCQLNKTLFKENLI